MAECYFDVLDETDNILDVIEVSGPVKIGRVSRDFAPDVPIPQQCGSASRQHATINYEEGRFVLEDHSRFGTLVNHRLVKNCTDTLSHGDLIIFGLAEDGWRIRFRVPDDIGGTTAPADPLELLTVTNVPRQVRIGNQIIEENLRDRPFHLLKFMSDHKGGWYPVQFLIENLWPDADRAPIGANEQLAHAKKDINDLLKPMLNGKDAIGSRAFQGYRMRPRLEE